MKHDKAMLNKLCDNCYFGDRDYRDAMKAYAEHLNQSRIDESARIRDLVLERKHWLETIAHKNEQIAKLRENVAGLESKLTDSTPETLKAARKSHVYTNDLLYKRPKPEGGE